METPFASIEYLEEQKAKLKILLQSLENILDLVHLDTFQIMMRLDSGKISCFINKETHTYTDYIILAKYIEAVDDEESLIKHKTAFELFDKTVMNIQPAWMDKHNRLARGEDDE